MSKIDPEPASVKLHTLHRPRRHLQSIATIERHRKVRGGQFPIPQPYQLTEIHDGAAEGAQWFRTEAAALRTAVGLGYEPETKVDPPTTRTGSTGFGVEIPDVVRTLIDQLGGGRIFAMAFRSMTYDTIELTPDRPASAGVAGVVLAIARALVRGVPERATHVIVNLMADDTYAVILHREPTPSESMRGKCGREVSRVDGVHAAQLRPAVERATGLLLTLGTLGGREGSAS